MPDVCVDLEYIKPLELYKSQKPYWLFVGKPAGVQDQITNVELELASKVPVHDFLKHGQDFKSFDNEDLIQSQYLPQVEKVLYDAIPYATRVHIFDWRT
ncbi:hypothetical protein COL922a_008051 [Colletotrichum nupharicola]|nr:hypothetical protein COL922a_008051 [Colletotrichum nupharicola]